MIIMTRHEQQIDSLIISLVRRLRSSLVRRGVASAKVCVRTAKDG